MTRWFPGSLFVWSLVGCGATTTNTVATDAATDARTTDAGPCGAMPGLDCYSGASGLCGDTFMAPVCRAGVWACPAGTVPSAMCRCFGSRPGCACAASGWVCPDAGTDAGTDAGASFACGETLRCALDTQYCRGVSGGIMAGTRYSCEALPAECLAAPSCACVAPDPGPESCRQEPDGSIHLSINAP